MKESLLQSKIRKKLKDAGWFVTKLIQTSTNGIPDLLIIRNEIVIFIEIKKEDGRLSPLQQFRIEEMKSFGAIIIIAHTLTDIEHLCKNFSPPPKNT